jgi:hypothetical protein
MRWHAATEYTRELLEAHRIAPDCRAYGCGHGGLRFTRQTQAQEMGADENRLNRWGGRWRLDALTYHWVGQRLVSGRSHERDRSETGYSSTLVGAMSVGVMSPAACARAPPSSLRRFGYLRTVRSGSRVCATEVTWWMATSQVQEGSSQTGLAGLHNHDWEALTRLSGSCPHLLCPPPIGHVIEPPIRRAVS